MISPKKIPANVAVATVGMVAVGGNGVQNGGGGIKSMPPPHLGPTIKEDMTDDELGIIIESLTTRIENSMSTLVSGLFLFISFSLSHCLFPRLLNQDSMRSSAQNKKAELTFRCL